ncbi:acetolactate synthase small subunit [Nanoarchaeota archaeon]
MKHTISMLVQDEPGVMTRISGMFARRGFNIDTITVGKTNTPGISKIVITVIGDDYVIEQVEKQLNKIISVTKLNELKNGDAIVTELCLVKVTIKNKKAKDEIIKTVEEHKAKIADLNDKSVIIQIIDEPKNIDTFLGLMDSFGIKDISRTGVTGMLKGL